MDAGSNNNSQQQSSDNARLQMAVPLTSRHGSTAKDGHIRNGYVERLGETTSIVTKRGGLTAISTLGTGVGQGMTNYVDTDGGEHLFTVQGGYIYATDILIGGTSWTSAQVATTITDGFRSFCRFGGYNWMLVARGVLFEVYYNSVISGGTWTLIASAPLGSSGGNVITCPQDTPVISFNNKMWIIGTQFGASRNDDVWSSPDGVHWTQASASTGMGFRSSARIVVYNNKIWMLGGFDSGGTWVDDIYSSDDGITWTLVQASPGFATRTKYGAGVFLGKMFVLGGNDGVSDLKDIWGSTDGVTWTQIVASPSYSVRQNGAVGVVAGLVHLMGGFQTGGTYLADYWTSPDLINWTQVSNATGYGGASASAFGYGAVADSQIPIRISAVAHYYPATTGTTTVSLGTVQALPTDFADFAKNLDGTQIMVKLTNVAYKLSNTTVLSQVSDVNYPTATVRGCVYLDGTFYVMEQDGTIWGSDLEDCTSWTSTNFITAEFEPDSGVAISKYNNYLVAFGQWTTQMFWDAANATGSPLSPVQNGVLLIGCAHAYSVCQVESTVIWMAQRKGQGSSFLKGRFIAMLEGTSYKHVSTPDIDRILDDDDLSLVASCMASFSGHTYYILSLGGSSLSLVYDLDQKLWYIWTKCVASSGVTISTLTQSNGLATATTSTAHGFSDGDPVTVTGVTPSGYNGTSINVNVLGSASFTYPVVSTIGTTGTGTMTAVGVSENYFDVVAACNFANNQVFQGGTNGKIFNIRDNIHQDDSVPINFKIRTNNTDRGNNERKFCFSIAPITDMVSGGTGLLRYTDDDYQTYSYYRRFDLSQARPTQQRFGNYRRRAWEWRMTQNIPHRIMALERDEQQGNT